MIGDAPMLRSVLRIPSGDATVSIFGTVTNAASIAMLWTNESPAPVVLAMTVVAPEGSVVRCVADGILVDGVQVVRTNRPARAASAFATPDDMARQLEIDAVSSMNMSSTGSCAAVVLGVPHRVTASAQVSANLSPVTSAAPQPEAVSQGWTHHQMRGPSLSGIASVAQFLQRSAGVLMGAPDQHGDPAVWACVAEALACAGATTQARDIVADLWELQLPSGGIDSTCPAMAASHLVRATDRLWWQPRTDDEADLLGARCGALLRWCESNRSDDGVTEVIHAVAMLLATIGQCEAAQQLASRFGSREPRSTEVCTQPVPLWVGKFGDPDLSHTAREYLDTVAAIVSCDRPLRPGESVVIRLFGGLSLRAGQNFEFAGFSTPAGSLAGALRWHGTNAALLWELTSLTGLPVQISAPGVSDSWSSSRLSGEELIV